MTSKADYQKWIWTYKRRREGLRRKTKNLSKKIRQWEACLKQRNQVQKKNKESLKDLSSKVNEYFQVNIKSNSRDLKHRLARNIYYKVGLESKIGGANLSRFVNRSKRMAMFGRKNLLSTFKNSEEAKQVYHSFKKYLEN